MGWVIRSIRAKPALGLAVAIAAALAAFAWTAVAATEVPQTSNLTAQPSTFCVRVSSTCSHTGTAIHFTVSTDATMTVEIRPRKSNITGYVEYGRGRGAAHPAKKVLAGNRSIRIQDSRLTPGRWTIKVQGINNVGASTTAIVDVHVSK